MHSTSASAASSPTSASVAAAAAAGGGGGGGGQQTQTQNMRRSSSISHRSSISPDVDDNESHNNFFSGSINNKSAAHASAGEAGKKKPKIPKRPPIGMFYHNDLENPEEAFILPFFRYLVQVQRNSSHEGEWFQCNGIGGGAGVSARSVKSQEAKMAAPHYVIEMEKKRREAAVKKNKNNHNNNNHNNNKNNKSGGEGGDDNNNNNNSQHQQNVATSGPDKGFVATAQFPRPPSRMTEEELLFYTVQQQAERALAASRGNDDGVSPTRVRVDNSVIENSIKVKPIPVRLPDTVIFMRRMPRAWFTYDEDMKMALRLPPLSLDTEKIEDYFTGVLPGSDGICALFFATDPDRPGSLICEPLRPTQLKEFLGGRPSILDRCPDGALQKYVPTSGRGNSFLEVVWSPSSCGVYPSQIHSLKDTPGQGAIRKEGETPSLTVSALHDQCFGMIGYFLPDLLRSERRRIIRFSALFRVDMDQRIWFVGCTCLRCAPLNEPFNNAIPRMPMGLLRPAPFRAPRLALTTPTLIVGKAPPERPEGCPKMTDEHIPFYFTPLHLRKPFKAGASVIDVAANALPKDLLFSALERENDLIHYARETNSFLGVEENPTSSRRTGAGGDGVDATASALGSAYYYRGASLRFRHHNKLNASANNAVKRTGRSPPAETAAERRKRHFEEKLANHLGSLREWMKRVADLVTETLLDALSAGLSVSMGNSSWREFVSTIILHLDADDFLLLQEVVEEEEEVAEKQNENNKKKKNRRQEIDQQAVIAVLKSVGASPPARLLKDPEAFAASPSFVFDELEQPDQEIVSEAQLRSSGRYSARKITPEQAAASSMSRGRFSKRTITPEATEWLWRLQRSFEESAKEKISHVGNVMREQFQKEEEQEALEDERERKMRYGEENEGDDTDDEDNNHPHHLHLVSFPQQTQQQQQQQQEEENDHPVATHKKEETPHSHEGGGEGSYDHDDFEESPKKAHEEELATMKQEEEENEQQEEGETSSNSSPVSKKEKKHKKKKTSHHHSSSKKKKPKTEEQAISDAVEFSGFNAAMMQSEMM